jgi:putative nucleotidyltransferase with HDIG domain
VGFPRSFGTDGKAELITDMSEWQQTRKRLRAAFRDVSPTTLLYVGFVASAALATAAALILWDRRMGSYPALAGLAVVAAFGERGRITLRPNFTVSISALPAIFAAVLLGPLAAMIVFAVSALTLSLPAIGRVAYFSSRALSGAIAAATAALVAQIVGPGTGEIVAAAAAVAFAAEIADAGFASVTFVLRRLGRWREAVREMVPIIAASAPFYGAVVAVLALAYHNLSTWTLPLFFAPAFAAQRWFLMYQAQRQLADDLKLANDQLKAANLSFAKGLIATLDARDRYTAGHSAAVATYARDIAARMGMTEEDQALAQLCGLVHDIGKIGLPAGLLEKPGALTLDERREMQRHSEIGERILANVDTYAEISSVVRHHHERVDGQGYPDGKQGGEIPLLSRIIAVADAYNAMTSDRPYRDAMPSRVARLRLAQAVETQFDTTVVAAFEAILAGATEDYRLAQGAEFTLSSRASNESSEFVTDLPSQAARVLGVATANA